MTAPRLRVLVVDDSAFMRRALTRMLSTDPEIEVAGTACDGQQALDSLPVVRPDVITMDVDMPVLDGLSALKQIVRAGGPPVVMVSTLTQAGSKVALDALEIGAFDFVPKPQGEMMDVPLIGKELVAKIKAAGRHKRGVGRAPAAGKPEPTRVPPPARGEGPHLEAAAAIEPLAGRAGAVPPRPTHLDIAAIGISTGGPSTLKEIIPHLPVGAPFPIIVAQHMPTGFTKQLADRLDRTGPLPVREGQDHGRLEPGTMTVAPAGWHSQVKRDAQGLYLRLLDASDAQTWYKPSVDILLASIALTCGPRALAIIMTGMGSDGLFGAQAIRDAGGAVWAQNEASCIVFGMPRVVIEAGLTSAVLGAVELAQELTRVASGARR